MHAAAEACVLRGELDQRTNKDRQSQRSGFDLVRRERKFWIRGHCRPTEWSRQVPHIEEGRYFQNVLWIPNSTGGERHGHRCSPCVSEYA